MPSLKPLGNELQISIHQLLSSFGWQKISRYKYVIVLEDSVFGGLGLLYTSYSTYQCIVLEPLIGLEYETVEKEVMRLRNLHYRRHISWTLSYPLAALTHRGMAGRWEFPIGVDIANPLEELTSSINNEGMQFLKSNVSLKSVCNTLMTSMEDYLNTSYRVPIILDMLGRRSEALVYCAQKLSHLQIVNPLEATQYQFFVDNFRDKKTSESDMK